jgi:RNA polymerase sigma factor (sigma-70 family)
MPDGLDGDLLRRFVHGDRDAFESLFRQFEREVYQWSFRIVRDASVAEDVVVEAFWRAYRGRAHFDPSRSFGAWMRRIATNVARDHLRAMRRRARWSRPIDDDVPAPATADRELGDSVARAFRRLPPLVVNRFQARRTWSRLDVSLAASVVIILLMFPGWLLVLAYHL